MRDKLSYVVLNVHRNHDLLGTRGRGGEGELYTYRYTVTTGMTSALKWAAMRAILMFHNCEEPSHKTVSTDHNFWRERRVEADSNRGPSAYQLSALPLDHTGSHTLLPWLVDGYFYNRHFHVGAAFYV